MTFHMPFKARSLARYALIATISIASTVAAVTASAQSIVVASTTSTEQSGLFPYLLPEFKKATGIDVKVVALGT
ncbi:MAG: tungsten ABC transporter substrate-binding protein, partial [Rhodoferax sp.]|nr:tungsten ABC transporter substrate-binding protein [Rhodoferax sp.]